MVVGDVMKLSTVFLTSKMSFRYPNTTYVIQRFGMHCLLVSNNRLYYEREFVIRDLINNENLFYEHVFNSTVRWHSTRQFVRLCLYPRKILNLILKTLRRSSKN